MSSNNKVFLEISKTEQDKLKTNLINSSNSNNINSIIDFEDLYLIKSVIDKLPNDFNKNKVAFIIYNSYITIKFFNAIISNNSSEYISDMYSILISGNLEAILENLIDIEEIFSFCNRKGKQDININMHLFVDNISDIVLQKVINTLFISNLNLNINTYTSGSGLLSYKTINNKLLKSNTDYNEINYKDNKPKIKLMEMI